LRRTALPLAGLCLLFALTATHLPTHGIPLLGDSSFFALEARHVGRRLAPARDILHNQPPLSALALANGPLREENGGPRETVIRLRRFTLASVILLAITLHLILAGIAGPTTWSPLLGPLFLLLGTPQLLPFVLQGEVRFYPVLLAAVAVLLLQQGRWAGAGLAGGLAAGFYYPSALLVAATGTAVALNQERDRRRVLGRFGAGFLLPPALLLLWLGHHGAAGSWYRLTLRWIPGHALDTLLALLGGAGFSQNPSLSPVRRLVMGYGPWFLWIPLLALAAYPLVLARSPRASGGSWRWRDRALLTPLLFSGLTMAVALVENGPRDQMNLVPFLALLAALAARRLGDILPAPLPRLLAGIVALVVAARFLAAAPQAIRQVWRRIPLERQERAAHQLNRVFPAEAGIWAVGEAWPVVLADRRNALPYLSLDPKSLKASRQVGAGTPGLTEELRRGGRPALVVVGRRRGSGAALLRRVLTDAGYLRAGVALGLELHHPADSAECGRRARRLLRLWRRDAPLPGAVRPSGGA
jgi:hypothetical protein